MFRLGQLGGVWMKLAGSVNRDGRASANAEEEIEEIKEARL
jgi:hypothetical protein